MKNLSLGLGKCRTLCDTFHQDEKAIHPQFRLQHVPRGRVGAPEDSILTKNILANPNDATTV